MDFWKHNAVIYQILIDRFAGWPEGATDTEPTWAGGTIKGIHEKLDYLQDLGINVVWLSPFLKSRSYHGYDTIDFQEVDEHFGTKADLKALLDDIHGRGMRALMDFVPNHCSNQHPFFIDAVSNPDSEYRDWFYFEDWPDTYLTYFDFKILPKLNLDHLPARDYIIKSAEYWVREYGFDGFRLDHAPGPSNSFWQDFRDRLKAINPDFIMIGEIALVGLESRFLKTIFSDRIRERYLAGKHLDDEGYAELMKDYIGLFDGALDFNFYGYMNRFARGRTDLNEVKNMMDELYGEFPDNFLLPNFLDSHDKNRYMHEAGNDFDKFRKAVKFQFSLPQPPIIYYGTEVGMTHDRPVIENSPTPGGDLPTRQFMNWQPNEEQKKLLEFYKKLIRNRTGDAS